MKIAKIIISISFLILTGCVKNETEISVNKDKSVDFSFFIATEEKNYEELKTTIKETPEYIYSKTYQEDGYKGVIWQRRIDNIDYVSTPIEKEISAYAFLDEEFEMFFIKEGFFKNKYKINLKTKPEEISEKLNTRTNKNQPLEYKYKISIPNKNLSSNATNIYDEGKSLEWDLNMVDFVMLEFELYNYTNIYITIGIILLFLIFIILKISKISKQEVKKEESFDAYKTLPQAKIEDFKYEPIIQIDNSTEYVAYSKKKKQKTEETIDDMFIDV